MHHFLAHARESNFYLFLDQLGSDDVTYYELTQRPGDVIFVPSMWYHQVWNVEDAISINHNWFNACNVETVSRCLRVATTDVQEELSDCRDAADDEWHDLCEGLLKAHFGMNHQEFASLLLRIAETRIAILNALDGLIFDDHILGKTHARFDLEAVNRVLRKMDMKFMPAELKKRRHQVDKLVKEMR